MSRKKLIAIVAACAAVIVLAVVLVPALTSTDTVRIRDWYDLHRVRDDLSGSYVLMNDLDATTRGYQELAGATAHDGRGWAPLGYARPEGEGMVGEAFQGTFDGQGYQIRDVFIDRADENLVGLFGMVGDEGLVRDVGVVSANVTGGFSSGILVGVHLGMMTNCYSTGYLSGHAVVGGLIGGTGYGAAVSSCFSTASVAGHVSLGGLVGMNSQGTISDSYATGHVARIYGSDTSIGGFVGRNRGGSIVNCYSSGTVSYQGVVVPTANGFAGTVAIDGDYEMTGNLWDAQASGQPASAGEAEGLTTARMMDLATYAGWSITAVDDAGQRDLAYTWNIVDGQTYPFLSWQRAS